MTPFGFDIDLFLALNGDCGHLMDQTMYIVSHEYTWIPLYAAVLAWVIWKKGWKTGLVLLVLCAAAVGLADQTATIMKHLVPKLRPTHYPPLEGLVHTVNGYKGGLYCTVSSHAGNCMVFAVMTSYFVRKRWYAAFIAVWLFVVSYSRIYLGVHYPTDIVLGFLDGMIWSWLAIFVYRKWISKRI